MNDRASLIDQIAAEIEHEMKFLGITAIEDKLQGLNI